jgi:hypothetical protein
VIPDPTSRSERATTLIQGQFLRLSARREVAIYLRAGSLWVADFIDGDGELFEPETWFRFNCGSLGARDAQQRMLREAGLPLFPEIVARIEALHQVAAAPGIAAPQAEDTP